MKKNMQEKVTRWSIRRLSVGVASVVVASGFFMITSPANSVLAKEGNVTPVTQTTQNKVDKEKESKSDDVNKLIKNAVDTALTNSNDSSTSPQSTENTTNKPIENKVEDRAATPAAETRTNSETPAAPVAETPTTVEETKPEQVKVAVKDNVKESIDVPAAYLEKAEGKGPFTAGVNQVIPYEFFAGDGMLTRLLLKASDKAPWSDNGKAENPALSPLGENVNTKGQYFYEVDLNGNTVGKQGQALIDQLRANGTQTYKATVKVYGNKDGKADLTNVVATKQVTIKINVKETSDTANGSFSPSNSGSGVTPMNHNHATGATHQMPTDHKDMMAPAKETDKAMPANDQMEKSGMKTETPAPGTTDSMPADTMTSSTNTMAGENMAASANKMSDTMMSDKMMSDDKAMLPNTGEAQTSMASIGFLGLALAGLLGGLGLKNKKEEN